MAEGLEVFTTTTTLKYHVVAIKATNISLSPGHSFLIFRNILVHHEKVKSYTNLISNV
jgi:hypothetical protein